jgi:hypothetical protein
MTRARHVLAVIVLAACETPVPTLHWDLAGPPSQACPETDCSMVTIDCPSVISIRIADPDDPAVLLLNQCTAIGEDPGKTMCALNDVRLDPTPLPVKRLEVEVAIYPRSAVTMASNGKDLVCPPRVQYGATGFPIEQAPVPALGGLAYYQPGDTTVAVKLGCTDLGSIRQSCAVNPNVTIRATVEDFSTRLQLSSNSPVANRLRVSAGEPHTQSGVYVLNPPDAPPLAPVSAEQLATWGADLPLDLQNHVCVEVVDDDSRTPATLRCKALDPAARSKPIDLTGTWVPAEDIDRILALVSPAVSVPMRLKDGLTLGIVVDQALNPVSGFVVAARTRGSVSYLTDAGGLGGNATQGSGMFVSTDAAFGTQFSARGPGGGTTDVAVGGLVASKLTVVVLVANGPLER